MEHGCVTCGELCDCGQSYTETCGTCSICWECNPPDEEVS